LLPLGYTAVLFKNLQGQASVSFGLALHLCTSWYKDRYLSSERSLGIDMCC